MLRHAWRDDGRYRRTDHRSPDETPITVSVSLIPIQGAKWAESAHFAGCTYGLFAPAVRDGFRAGLVPLAHFVEGERPALSVLRLPVLRHGAHGKRRIRPLEAHEVRLVRREHIVRHRAQGRLIGAEAGVAPLEAP